MHADLRDWLGRNREGQDQVSCLQGSFCLFPGPQGPTLSGGDGAMSGMWLEPRSGFSLEKLRPRPPQASGTMELLERGSSRRQWLRLPDGRQHGQPCQDRPIWREREERKGEGRRGGKRIGGGERRKESGEKR